MASTNSMRKGKSVREVFVNFAEMCSMQGVPYIHAATFWWSRLIWVVLTFTAIGALIFHLYYIMSQYYEYPVQTKVSLGFNNLQLPAITICNVNVLRKSKMYEINSTEMLLLRNLVEAMAWKELNNFERRKRFADENSAINITNNDGNYFKDFGDTNDNGYLTDQGFKYTYMNLPRDVRKDAGHFMSDMIVSCSFAGRECTAKDFTLHQTADYGNCWELNTTDMIVKRSGDNGGLSLTLNLQNWEILEGVSEGYGARLVVHEPGTIPFTSSEGIFISSSFETNIGLRMVAVSRLGEPYSHCDDGKTFRERYGVTYTRQTCQEWCLTYTLIQVCGCYEESEEELGTMAEGTTRQCKNKTEIICSSKVIQEYQDKEISCDCFNPCNENGYVKTISSRPWPTVEYSKIFLAILCIFDGGACSILMQNYNDSRLLSFNFLKLNVYFEDLNFEKIDEAPEISFTQLLSDVGGAIGLWIGLSVLALCEIFHLILELCALGVNRCYSKGQTQHTSQDDIERSRDGEMIDTENRHQKQTGQNRTHVYVVPVYSSLHDQYQQRFGYQRSSQH